MPDVPADKLRDMIRNNGTSLIKDRQRLEAYLRDYFPGYKKEVKILIALAEEGLIDDLLSNKSLSPDMIISRHIQKLCDEHGYMESVAIWGAEAWAYALGISHGHRQPDPVAPPAPTYLPINKTAYNPYAPMFKGSPARTGTYDSTPIRKISRVKWKFKTFTYTVYSSPAVSRGLVYIGGNDHIIYALDAGTGHLKWSYKTGNKVDSSPAIADDTVFVGSFDGHLYALDAMTGDLKWKYKTNDKIYSSPVVVDDVVYVGSRDKNVYAIGAKSGRKIWAFPTGKKVDSSPAVADGIVYCGSDDRCLYALDAATGRQLWKYSASKVVRSSPAVEKDRVYCACEDNSVYALEATSGKLIWRYQMEGFLAYTSCSPVIVNDTVYIGSSNANLYSLKAATGALNWKFTSDGQVLSSPALAGDTICFASSAFGKHIYGVDRFRGIESWKIKMEYGTESSPAAIDGVVYIGGGDGHIYALY